MTINVSQKRPKRPLVIALGSAVVLFLAVSAGYSLGTRTAGDAAVRAAPAVLEPRASETPIGSSVDTSKPGWDQPYLKDWAAKPRRDMLVNGIAVGPTVEPDITFCSDGRRVPVAAEAAEGTALALDATYLPQGAVFSPDKSRLDTDSPALVCDGAVVINNGRIDVPADPQAAERVAGGESWFDVPHGGYVMVTKVQLAAVDTPAMRSDVPAESWYAADVAGHQAAIGRPVLDGGLGAADAVVWDDDTRVETLIHSYNVSLAELLKIAEGLTK